MGKTIAVFGLGSMGYGIAGSLLRAGHVVFGADVVQSSVDRFVSEGGARLAQESVAELDIAVTVVLNAAQTEDVLFGAQGAVPAMREGACVISCATVPPTFARSMEARCAENGVLYLDAPISGGPVKAGSGELTMMASGAPAAFAAARPALDAMAERVFELGKEAGAGSAMKAVNQLLAGVHIATMAEALAFGLTQGVAPEEFLEVISQCAGTSWMLENRAPHIIEGDYTPRSAVDIWPKDLGIVLDMARSAKFSAPITAAALQQFLAASGSGLGREDDAAVAKVYARNAGLCLPGRQLAFKRRESRRHKPSSDAVNQAASMSEAACCSSSHETMETKNATVCCGPQVKSPAVRTRAENRHLDIDFLYLDLSVCERCQDTESTLEEAIEEVVRVLETTGIRVSLNNIQVTSEEQAVALGFLVSPTIRVNGRDIQKNFRESLCESCGTICECEGGVSCREWEYQGQWYTAPPKGLIIEAILKEVYGGAGAEQEGSQKAKEAPDNLKRFFSGLLNQEVAGRS